MTSGPSFEEFLLSKKIDSDAFKKAEPELWNAWKIEFEQVHPNSFTVQKLNLINPVRRKYLLQKREETTPTESAPQIVATPTPTKPGKPLMRPKPKMN